MGSAEGEVVVEKDTADDQINKIVKQLETLRGQTGDSQGFLITAEYTLRAALRAYLNKR